LFPELDYLRRKFTPTHSSASAGFRPHLKQGVVFADKFTLGSTVSLATRQSLACHSQELDERSNILLVGVHDIPLTAWNVFTDNAGRCVVQHNTQKKTE
jgi:hypothetical protein